MLLFGLGATWVGASTTWYLISNDHAHNPAGTWVPVGIFTFITLFGLYLLWAVPKYRIVLYPDRIELREFLRPRILLRDEIQGRRTKDGSDSGGNIILVPRGGGREFTIEATFSVDAGFWQWIESLPDLDAIDLRDSREKILAAPEGTPAREERREAFGRARSFSRIAIGATVAAGLWAWFFPQVYSLAVLACLPWLTVFILCRSKGLFRIFTGRNDAHPDMTFPFVVPGVVLMACCFGVHMLDWEPLLVFSAALGLVLWSAAAVADSSLLKDRTNFILMLLFTALYGFGASREANALLDRSPGAIYRASVVGKHTQTGKSTSYYLELGSWGPDMRMGDESVPSTFYSSVNTGDKVCVVLRQGALRVPWYAVTLCDQAAPITRNPPWEPEQESSH
ncbi:MAG: hypothetical protein ACM3SW_01365 [Actinomycetota bacterium]